MLFENIVAAQTAAFLESLAVGAVLGLIYDGARVLRLIFPVSRRALFASDFLYAFAAAFVTFAFLMKAANGQPRFFLLLGEGLGFALWHISAGELIFRAADAALRVLKRAVAAAYRPLRRIWKKILNKSVKKLNILKKNFKNLVKRTYKLLQMRLGIVYNLLYLNMMRAFAVCGRRAGEEISELEDESKSAKEPDRPRGADHVRRVSGVFADKLSGRRGE